MEKNDPIGTLIEDYLSGKINAEIIVESDLSEDDVITARYLFRNFHEMPQIEKKALESCKGEILDVGCGAGPHLKALKDKGIFAEGLDVSKKACEYLSNLGFTVYNQNFQQFSKKKFDTLLLLMSGIGLAGDLQSLPEFLKHAKNLLKPDGKILCDSTDVSYFYEDDEGGMWMDLNAAYYGEFTFKMTYKDNVTDWFKWLYVDFKTLKTIANEAGLSCEIIEKNKEESSYLAELKVIK
jgi:SAM-dependent methyltransferase